MLVECYDYGAKTWVIFRNLTFSEWCQNRQKDLKKDL